MRTESVCAISAVEFRNNLWASNTNIPSWVNVKNVGLDQYFTSPDVAAYCYNSLTNFLNRSGSEPQDFLFVEPSAGSGAFLNLLPPTRRIGLDVMPMHSEVVQIDFLSCAPPLTEQEIVIVGNPPFGHGSWLALAFINHAAKFAKYVGFILPMSFQSDGKGSPKLRVDGMRLVHSEVLPANSFVSPTGKVLNVNALWQVWERGVPKTDIARTCKSWVDVFTVDNRSVRQCGQQKALLARCFVQRTFYGVPPGIVENLSDVANGCAYGIIIKRETSKLLEHLSHVNWESYSNRATCNRCHITKYHIERAVCDGGFYDT